MNNKNKCDWCINKANVNIFTWNLCESCFKEFKENMKLKDQAKK